MRVFCFVIESLAGEVPSQWDSLAGSCLHGTLGPAAEGENDARRAILDPSWIKAVTSSRLSVVAVGEEWKAALPPRFRGKFVGNEAGGSISQRLSQLEHCNANEPWELLSVWLPVSSSDADQLDTLRKFIGNLPPDIGSIGVLFNPKSKSSSQWLCSAAKMQAADAGPRPIEDVLVTMLAWLGVTPPKPFKGSRLEIAPEKTSGYSPAEEREIQKRLEDLGYL
jgi:hypothetical protein